MQVVVAVVLERAPGRSSRFPQFASGHDSIRIEEDPRMGTVRVHDHDRTGRRLGGLDSEHRL
jgi:hypothetical protein